MKLTRVKFSRFLPACAALFVAFAITPARAGELSLPPEVPRAIEKMYNGDPDAAIAISRTLQQSQPDNPLGYLVEGEADWWKMYCAACEIKWGFLDAFKRGKRPDDDAYLALAEKAVQLAHMQLAKSDTAEMHLYAGIGLALQARLYGLRDERRATARTAVSARAEFIHALQLDPQLADASFGLGLYNYYVDTLSPMVKFLRFFMGIPGGNKKEGIQQLETAMNHGVLMSVEARFYLAKNLRTYEQQYESAANIIEPLVTRYPQNPIFLLLLGNLNVELGRNAKAAEYLHAVLNLPVPSSGCSACAACPGCNACSTHSRELANSFLASIH
jgi:hypothetical protein